MLEDIPRFYFDFVDPLSYRVHLALVEIEATSTWTFERIGVELRPPPLPLRDAADPWWAGRWSRAQIRAPLGAGHGEAPLVPWSRKAHELHLFAKDKGVDRAVAEEVFEAYIHQGKDIGRIDVLVDIGVRAGLDRMETKATLDVDRWTHGVEAAADAARAAGVTDLPAMRVGPRLVQGFHNLSDLSTLLPGPP